MARGLGRLGLLRAASDRRRSNCLLPMCAGCLGAGLLVCLVGAAIAAALISMLAATVPGVNPTLACDPRRAPCVVGAAWRIAPPMTCAGLHVSQGYGDTPWEHPHTGIDLVCPAGTVVVAVTPGVFHRRVGAGPCAYPAGASGGLGTYGQLDAGDAEYWYGHLEAFAASDGASVARGTPLGFEGSSGCSSGYHLHFEVHVDGVLEDPCLLLPAGYPETHDATDHRCWGAAAP